MVYNSFINKVFSIIAQSFLRFRSDHPFCGTITTLGFSENSKETPVNPPRSPYIKFKLLNLFRQTECQEEPYKCQHKGKVETIVRAVNEGCRPTTSTVGNLPDT